MKRNQLQIGIDAFKKQLNQYVAKRDKATEDETQARQIKEIMTVEIDRLVKQIKQLEKPAESTEADKVLKALEG